MASIASSSAPFPSTSSSSSLHAAPVRTEPVNFEGPTPQTGPLPRKRGEIGFQEAQQEEHETRWQEVDIGESGQVNDVADPRLAARHPADRDVPPLPVESNTDAPAAAPTPPAPSASTAPVSDSSSTHSTSKNRLIAFLEPKHIAGLRVWTLLIFVFKILFLAGTVTGWIIIAQSVKEKSEEASDDNNNGFGQGTGMVFIHVAFAVVTLAEILFIERSVFRLRAERYGFKHPGGTLPHHLRRSPSNNPALALAPWHRPSLPTYAAALAETGHGTGDVEDNIIAVAPPPAYGNTRGSVLLLQGYLRDSLRAQARRQRDSASTASIVIVERPLSYRSHDSDWEEVLDADTARRLEETLAQLEEGQEPSDRRIPSSNSRS